MTDPTHFQKLEAMYLSAPINDYYLPTIHISQGRTEVSVAVRPDFYHAAYRFRQKLGIRSLNISKWQAGISN